MLRHLKYAGYVVRHKWFVFKAGRQLGVPYIALIIHDWSKLTPREWGPYVEYFYGTKNRDTFDQAWLHHQHKNPHHWQHWVLTKDDGSLKPLRMPDRYVKEMVADWMGAGKAITGEWDVTAWYEQNQDSIVLHPESRVHVEQIIKNTQLR